MQSASERDYQAVIDTPIPGVGSLAIRLAGKAVQSIELLPERQHAFVEAPAREAAQTLLAYLEGRAAPSRPQLAPQGTPFQQRVWRALQAIPAGEVRRYGELAAALGTSARAVAAACRANPIPLLIPCHRVVAAAGPGGYMGQTRGEALAIKLWLLRHEGHG